MDMDAHHRRKQPPAQPSDSEPAMRHSWMAPSHDKADLFAFAAPPAQNRKSQRELDREQDDARRLAIRKDRELNKSYFDQPNSASPPSKSDAESGKPQSGPQGPSHAFGDKGSSWRMMKLKRVFDIAKEEGRSIEDVALERYGSMDVLQHALDERAFLDRAKGVAQKDSLGLYRPSTKPSNAFRAPYQHDEARQNTSQDQHRGRNRDQRHQTQQQQQRGSYKIPSALASVAPQSTSSSRDHASSESSHHRPVLTKDQLNKLNAQILRAKMTRQPDLAKLEAEYKIEKARFDAQSSSTGPASGRGATESGPRRTNQTEDVVVLPTVDAKGRLYDLGSGSGPSATTTDKRKRLDTDTHDARGNRLRYAKSEESQTLNDLVLQERLGRGSRIDNDLAYRIATDAQYTDDLDYMDDSADRFAKRKELTDDQKRQTAIGEYRKSQTAQSKCAFCFHDGSPPRVNIAAFGVKTYLAMPETIEMVPGHCLIVPVQHVLSTLELEDDAWDEIRNFQKCLIQMAASGNQGMLFMEQVIDFKWHKHTVIECIPVPMDLFEDAPAYFKEALISSDEEWSQHKKIINTDRGFRKSMVKNLPYFHIWFDPNRGFGHIIENADEWPVWFGKEVIAGVMDLPPNKWRKPKRPQPAEQAARLKSFQSQWKAFDWTKMFDDQATSAS